MSVLWPWAPPWGWCRSTRALGRMNRRPFSPAARMMAAAEAAWPMHVVETGELMKFMVSRIPKRATMSPPGELTYRLISFSGFSPSRNSSWAMIRLATLSSMALPRNTIRSRSRRL